MSKKVNIGGKEFVSLPLSLFNEAMEVIHSGNEYSSDYIPRLKEKVYEFSKRNEGLGNVFLSIAFYRWMDIAYDIAEKSPLPWRPIEIKGRMNAKQSTTK